MGNKYYQEAAWYKDPIASGLHFFRGGFLVEGERVEPTKTLHADELRLLIPFLVNNGYISPVTGRDKSDVELINRLVDIIEKSMFQPTILPFAERDK